MNPNNIWDMWGCLKDKYRGTCWIVLQVDSVANQNHVFEYSVTLRVRANRISMKQSSKESI